MMVSISCITYNHAPYIRECLDGFLMQKCNFDFEILIHDDASTDGTQDIIKEYQQKHPDIIKPIFQIENQYSKGQRGINIKYNFSRAKGKYIALCEGDDYWIDPLKLQKQVDFLEENEDYSANITNRKFDDLVNHQSYITNYPELIRTEHILKGEVLPTQTVLFRNILKQEDFNKFNKMIAGDRVISYLLSLKGPIHCIKDCTAIYNYTGNGVWSSKKAQNQNIINIKNLIDFHDRIGLRRGNKYIFSKLYTLINDKINRKNNLNYRDLHRDFGFGYMQIIYVEFRIFISKIKNNLIHAN